MKNIYKPLTLVQKGIYRNKFKNFYLQDNESREYLIKVLLNKSNFNPYIIELYLQCLMMHYYDVCQNSINGCNDERFSILNNIYTLFKNVSPYYDNLANSRFEKLEKKYILSNKDNVSNSYKRLKNRNNDSRQISTFD